MVSREGGLRRVVEETTQRLASFLEEMIRTAPTQWHLMQPNWPSDHAAIAAFRNGSAARAPSGGSR